MSEDAPVPMPTTGWHIPKQLFKYLLSGITVAVFELALLYAFTEYLHIWYLFSAILAFFFAFCLSFSLQKFWTFQDTRKEGIPAQVSLYLFVSVCNLGINVVALYLLVQVAGLWYMFAQVLINGGIAVWSFVLYKFVIFKFPKTESY